LYERGLFQLSDPVARIPGFGPVTPLEFPFPAAAKTGTSRHFTDNWAVAVTGALGAISGSINAPEAALR
jgi:hypothetical protein